MKLLPWRNMETAINYLCVSCTMVTQIWLYIICHLFCLRKNCSHILGNFLVFVLVPEQGLNFSVKRVRWTNSNNSSTKTLSSWSQLVYLLPLKIIVLAQRWVWKNHLYLKEHLLSVSKKHVSFAFQWKIHKKMFSHTLNMKKEANKLKRHRQPYLNLEQVRFRIKLTS